MKPLSIAHGIHSSNAALTREAIETALRQPGKGVVRRQSVDLGEVESQRLHREIETLEREVGRMEARDDGAPGEGILSQQIQRQMHLQRRYEKTAMADFYGTAAWARLRRAQLERLPGGEVVSMQYGSSFAKDISRAPNFARLNIDNRANGVYQRMVQGEATVHFMHQLFQAAHPKDAARQRTFVDSAHAVRQIMARYKVAHPEGGKLEGRQVATGLFAVLCDTQQDWKNADHLVETLGVRPSDYRVIEAWRRASAPLSQPVASATVDNVANVQALKGEDGLSSAARLREVPAQLGTATLAHAAGDLLDSLTRILSIPQKIEPHRHNPVLATGLTGLKLMAESLPSLATNSARFGNAYRALLEETHIVLRELRPYNLQSFKMAASARVSAALPQPLAKEMVKPESFLTASGMQALTQALDLTRAVSKTSVMPLAHADKVSPFYYEGQAYLDTFQPKPAESDTPNALYATLADSFVHSPSTPFAQWNVNDVVAGIEQQMKQRQNASAPLTVVLDTTIEREGDMDKLLGALGPHLASDQLRMLLCKSHQKYANLASSKVAGGNVILLGAKTPVNERLQAALRNAEKEQGRFDGDESQLLTHLTRTAQLHEPQLLKQAIDNGNFVVRHCFNGRDGHTRFAGHDPELPFAMISQHDAAHPSRLPGFVFNNGEGSQRLPLSPSQMLSQDAVRSRGSFGFSESTMDSVGSPAGYDDQMLRLAFGQENHAELIERFWMPSREMQLDRTMLDAHQAHAEVMKLVNEALTAPQHRELQGLPLSEKLRYIGRLESATLNDTQRSEGDIIALRGALAEPEGYTLNKIASIVGHVDHLLRTAQAFERFASSMDREPIQSLVNGLIASGMPNVSPLGREKILGLQSELCFADMRSDDAETRRAGVETLLKSLKDSGVSPLIGLFNHSVPDQAYEQCPLAVREQLIDLTFSRLDIQSKLTFLKIHSSDRAGLAFIADCSRQLAGQLKGTTGAQTEPHWRSTIGTEMIRRGIVNAASAPAGQG